MPRWKERIGGVFMILLGGGLTGWTWYTALHEGYYYVKASMLFPAFAVMGVALILFPGYKSERMARGEDISELTGTQLLTPRWWGVLVVALIAGLGNYLLLSMRR